MAPTICIGRQPQCDLCTLALHHLEGDRQVANPLLLAGLQMMLATKRLLMTRRVATRRKRRQRSQRSPIQRSGCRVHRMTAVSRQLIRPATVTPGKARKGPELRRIPCHLSLTPHTCLGAWAALQGAAQALVLCRVGASLNCVVTGLINHSAGTMSITNVWRTLPRLSRTAPSSREHTGQCAPMSG